MALQSGRTRRSLPCVAVTAIVVMSMGCADTTPPPAPQPTGLEEAAQPAAGEPEWFTEASRTCGVDFTYISGAKGDYHMPEIMGGGVAIFDMDSDGDLDLYFVQGGDLQSPDPSITNRLYENQGDGTFIDITAGSGAADDGYGMGVAAGDYDNDGDLDLYVTNVGRSRLFANNGRGRFTDVTDLARVGHKGWSTSAAFSDLNRDGHLDLYVCRYLEWSVDVELECFNTMGGIDYCSPRNYLAPAMDVCYLNNGDGTFTDATVQQGISAPGTGLGVICADFTMDGWPDIFVANDGMPDQLWIRQPESNRYVDQAIEYGCAFDNDGRAAAGMGVATSDVDHDGDLDVLVCNLRNESDTFLRNESGSFFTNATALVGLGAVSRAFTRFGVGWYDFNQDGLLDLYEANGRVMRQGRDAADPYAEPNILFRGLPDGRFAEVTPRGGVATPLIATSRAAAFGDLNRDGAIDVVVVNRDGPAHVLMNQAPQRGNAVTFDVRDTAGQPALGATLTIRVGDRQFRRDVLAAGSYLASSDPRVHFALGNLDTVDAVTVYWADGTTLTYGSFPAGGVHILGRIDQ